MWGYAVLRSMRNSLPQRLRARYQLLHKAARGRLWFPHLPLALMLIAGGAWMLHVHFGWDWMPYFQSMIRGNFHVNLKLLPTVLIGGGMELMGIALLWRSRLAWVVALLLSIVATINVSIFGRTHVHVLLAYFSLLALLLLLFWRHFDRTSLAASTLFAITSVVMLLLYATFGSFYLGAEFHPKIHDLVTALYYSMVTMSTVGYGDIVPTTPEARLFTVSIIVLGVAIFATSLTAVIAPLVSQSLQRIINRKGTDMKRENHFVVIGNTPLALNTWRELVRRGRSVTRVLREAPDETQTKDVDLVIGDPSMTDTLREAGADKAEAVLAMMADDSENAFCVLAVRELGAGIRTVAAVNDARHLGRIKLVQPDVVIAPQVFGGELTAMLLSGEPVTPEFIMQSVFQQVSPQSGDSPEPPGKAS